MRGRFIRADGFVLPNNISKTGAQMILEAAFRNEIPAFYVGLVVGAPDVDMTMASMEEPTLAVNGYSRVNVARNEDGWPVSEEVAGERVISTDWLTWTPTGSGFDKPIQRLALLGTDSGLGLLAPVYALSAPLPEPIYLLAATPLSQRQFRYEIYL